MKEQQDKKTTLGQFWSPKRKIALLVFGIIAFMIAAYFIYQSTTKVAVDQKTTADVNKDGGTIVVVEDPKSENETAVEEKAEEKSATDYFNEGRTFMTQEKWQDAINSFDQAIALNSKNPEYYNSKSQAAYDSGQKQQAIDILKAGIAENPDSDLLKSRLDVLQKNWVGSQPQ